MTTECIKRCRSSSADIISNLPQDVIETILSHLSLRDAARTSILSRIWRNKWRSRPCLRFDVGMFNGTTRNLTHDMLLTTLFQVVSHHNGNLEKFVLSLVGLRSCPEIDHLISLASNNRGFKDFVLRILDGDEHYKLPLSLYSWAELNILTLGRCVIQPPPSCFKGFNKLAGLYIDNCSIRPDVLSGLVSSSPVLELLYVGSCIPIESHIEISAPNLRKLFVYCRVASICFKYAPLLSTCHLTEYAGKATVDGSYSNIQSVHNLTAINELILNYYYVGDKSYSSSIQLTTPLHILTLFDISFCRLPEVTSTLNLIRSSPNLGKFKAFVSAADGGSWDHTLFQAHEWSEVKLYNLRVVRVIGISGTPPELNFIGLLLAISPKLKRMFVRINKRVTPEKREEILTEVLSFVPLSPVAKVAVKY